MKAPRTTEEIDRAHTLFAIALQLDAFPTDEDRNRTRLALSVLCWALGHDHENAFETILEELQSCEEQARQEAAQHFRDEWNNLTSARPS